MLKPLRSLIVFIGIISLAEIAFSEDLLAPLNDAASFEPAPSVRRAPANTKRGPAAVRPEADDVNIQGSREPADDKLEAAWILPPGYEGGPGCDQCEPGLYKKTLKKIPLEMIQKGDNR